MKPVRLIVFCMTALLAFGVSNFGREQDKSLLDFGQYLSGEIMAEKTGASPFIQDETGWILGFSYRRINHALISKLKSRTDSVTEAQGMDLTGENFTQASLQELWQLSHDTKTSWPEENRLPPGFRPNVVLTSAINPGLGIRKLHEYGITGKGISVAVIDKPILSTHRAYESGRYFLSEMQKIRDKSILIKDVRGKGLMLGVELSDRRQNNRNLSEKIYQEMLCRKFIIGLTPKSNMLRFFPPLIMSEKHISNMCSALEEIFSKVEQRKL